MIPVLASCAVGTTPCDDTGGALALPSWLLVVGVVVVLAVVAGLAAVVIRGARRPPWS